MARDSDFFLRLAPETGILAAAILLLVPLRWALAWITAALWHELFHCLALLLCGRRVYGISIGICGAQIYTDNLRDLETFVCALAGPVGGLTLLLFSAIFPRLALCGLLQSIFNLLPVYPLDGGRVLRGITAALLPEKWANRICVAVETAVFIITGLLGFVSCFIWKLGIFPAIFAVLFIAQRKKRKRPCKTVAYRVQ